MAKNFDFIEFVFYQSPSYAKFIVLILLIENEHSPHFMKKLIPILFITTLSSCSHTTPLNAYSIPTFSDTVNVTIPSESMTLTSQNEQTQTMILPLSNRLSQKLEKGLASWYGNYFHGKKTATGELFDMNAMTAAHNSLPLDSYAEITNVENKKTVIVRINDRGHFHHRRILDLSYSAAKKLGMNESGTGHVEIKTIDPKLALEQLQKQNLPIYLQVSSFKNKKLAEDLLKNLSQRHLLEPKILTSSNQKETLYKVQLPVKSSHHINELNTKLVKLGFTDKRFVTETN